MSGLKLYMFSCGTLEFDPSLFLPDLEKGKKVNGPVPFYLLEHPKGRVLVDTGCHPSVVEDPLKAWGGLTRAFYPKVNKNDLASEQLLQMGIDPDSIDIVVCTHLHMDHAGGNCLFPNAKFLVHRKEWETVQDPSLEGKGYFRKDWDHPLNYIQVEDGYDIFGDGSAVLQFLPGHSPGHMGVILKLDNSGTVVLAIDAVPMAENIKGPLPKNITNVEETQSSVNKVKSLVSQGARVISGHDPDQWATLKKAPAYLD
ncbi:N-acyl homoserine lactonase family protein [Bacillus sp. Marseille-P3661]|uniref:N-acyl homoserine lactonase family protein n=1 Tax=Bacillus sp. Marseille-P3661 TaxID=1936234 RepID=UPI000C825EF8|nr:N-acyl homoserine lactonase family protein [Bacillus sp. Marseille-P3661]